MPFCSNCKKAEVKVLWKLFVLQILGFNWSFSSLLFQHSIVHSSASMEIAIRVLITRGKGCESWPIEKEPGLHPSPVAMERFHHDDVEVGSAPTSPSLSFLHFLALRAIPCCYCCRCWWSHPMTLNPKKIPDTAFCCVWLPMTGKPNVQVLLPPLLQKTSLGTE